MVLFIFFIIFALIALLVFVAAAYTPAVLGQGTRRERSYVRALSGVILVISLIFLLFSSFTMVGTKNVAVLTVGGRPTGYLTNGIHFKAPWAKPHQLSDAVQTDTYASDTEDPGKKQGGATETCVHVRVERQAVACVNVSIRWQIKPSGVDYLYRNYKSNEHITDNVVLRDLQQAMNEAFADYDPLGVDQNGNSTNPPLTAYGNRVVAQMRSEIGEWIDVQSVIIPLLNYDPATQSGVQKLLQQIAATRQAIQAEQTAKAQAAANRALAASVSNDPNVLVSKCLDIWKELADKNIAPPAGTSCFPGAGSPVAVGVK